MNPCQRCNGSGTEPNPADLAFNELMRIIGEAQIIEPLKVDMRRAAAALRKCAGEVTP